MIAVHCFLPACPHVERGDDPRELHAAMELHYSLEHAVRLHEALSKVGVTNQLLTIPGGRHGGFTPDERTRIFVAIREFLAKNGLGEKQ